MRLRIESPLMRGQQRDKPNPMKTPISHLTDLDACRARLQSGPRWVGDFRGEGSFRVLIAAGYLEYWPAIFSRRWVTRCLASLLRTAIA